MEKSGEIKKHIEINGAILSENAIHELNELQQSDNELTQHWVNKLGDVISFIAGTLNGLTETQHNEGIKLLSELPNLRDTLNQLKKP